MATATIRPTGAGGETDLKQYPTSGANWDKVAEVTSDGDTTYVYENVPTQAGDFWDLYTYPAGPGSGTINSVTIYLNAKYVTCPTTRMVETIINTHSTNYPGGWTNLTTAYALYSKAYATNPNTGLSWTWAEITALQAGPRFYSSDSTGSLRCTQAYVVIDYTGVAAPTVTTQAATSLGLD